jgi:hypothetical protein
MGKVSAQLDLHSSHGHTRQLLEPYLESAEVQQY